MYSSCMYGFGPISEQLPNRTTNHIPVNREPKNREPKHIPVNLKQVNHSRCSTTEL